MKRNLAVRYFSLIPFVVLAQAAPAWPQSPCDSQTVHGLVSDIVSENLPLGPPDLVTAVRMMEAQGLSIAYEVRIDAVRDRGTDEREIQHCAADYQARPTTSGVSEQQQLALSMMGIRPTNGQMEYTVEYTVDDEVYVTVTEIY